MQKIFLKPNYDPIKDAPFNLSQSIPFSFVTQALIELENQSGPGSKELKKDILSNLFRSILLLSPHELSELFYFFCVRLSPEYEGIETNIGIELIFKAIAKRLGTSKKEVKIFFTAIGDIGIVTEQGILALSMSQVESSLTFTEVFQSFRQISQATGAKSQNEKENIVLSLL